MSEAPKLVQLNLLVDDMAASLDFYRRLGVGTADGESGPHVELSVPGEVGLELDTAESARLWHAGFRADAASGRDTRGAGGAGGARGARGGRVVIGFSLPSREAVDTAYAELTAAGYRGRQEPFDAFWGGRYAIVADPSGNDVALISPVDASMRSWPPEESPG